jgi:hypothetical protein
MYINLSNIPQWVLENSLFLKTLKEDCSNEDIDNDNYYIPFLDHYNHTFDFSLIFEKNAPYLNLDSYMHIYLDIFKFLDFIGFEISFNKLIIPKDYKNIFDLLIQNNEVYNHFVTQIVGVQYYAFHLQKFNPHNVYQLDMYLKKSIENDDYEWILWYIKNVNKLNKYQHILFDFDYNNVSIKTFDLLYSINNVCYPNICESIIKYRKNELFIKYINQIKNTYNDESLLRLAFERQPNENLTNHMEFVKLMLYYGYKFHFIYEYSKNTYYSNNPLLMEYMYKNYKEQIDKNIVDICPVLYSISLKNNICNFNEKMQILEFFMTNYTKTIQMEKLLHYIFSISSKIDNLNKNIYDFDFIYTLIERTGNMNNIYSYMVYLYFNYKCGIETYIESCKNKDNKNYDISKFRNTFKYVLLFRNVEYIDFYIKNKLYINDGFIESDYLKCLLYDVNLFKMIYHHKIGNIQLNDSLFISAYENHNIHIILFMIQEKYIPSERVKVMIKNDYMQSVDVNHVEKNGVIEVTKFYTNTQFEYKEKIYNMICVN